jgi:signal transduction histidine kinase
MRSLACLAGLLLFTDCCAMGQTTPQAENPVSRIADIRGLSSDEAARNLPVRVRGVVQWASGGAFFAFTVADDSAAIYVSTVQPLSKGKWSPPGVESTNLQPGLEVEVDGVTRMGGYAPIIDPKRVRIIGKGKPLPLRQVTIAHLHSGSEDAQRIELETVVVQSVIDNFELNQRVLLGSSGTGNYALILVPPAPWNEPAKVIDAQVRVRGTVLTLYNSRAEQMGVRITVPGEEDFQILVPPPPDPFGVPKVEIGSLRRFRPEGLSPHRRLVEGVITLVSSDELIIQGQGRGVGAKVGSTGGFKVGDHVRIAGFLETRQPIAFLANAMAQKISGGEPPVPTPSSVEDILEVKKNYEGRYWGQHPEDFDNRLVQLKGTLIGALKPGAEAFTLQSETGSQVLVRFASGSPGFSQPPPAGSLVELTGVANILHSADSPLPEFIRAVGMELMLRGPADVRVLRTPPWWNARRLWFALLSSAAVLAVALTWASLLRRTVKRQSVSIEQALRSHRNAELEHEAAKRERLRLAGDLHDGVHQLLNAASYRLESVASLAPRDSAAALPHVHAAQKILNRSQHEMRSLMWGIHEMSKEPPDFAELLTQALAGMDHWPADLVEVTSQGEPVAVPARAAGSLLLLTQEAVENALRHGRATRVYVHVDFTAEALGLTIQDDGCGFDPKVPQPSPHGGLGLGSMKRRVDELAGTFNLKSVLGEGTTLRIVLPWPALRLLFPTPALPAFNP